MAVQKFAFDRCFDGPSPTEGVVGDAAGQRVAGDELEDERIEAACALARADGFAAGLAQARLEQQALLAELVRGLTAALQANLAGAERFHAALATDAVDLALAIGDGLASEALARSPLAGAETVIRTVLAEQFDRPRLVLSVSPADHGALAACAETQSLMAGYEGRLVVRIDESIGDGDCIVDWGGGGVAHVLSERRERVVARLGALLASERDPA